MCFGCCKVFYCIWEKKKTLSVKPFVAPDEAVCNLINSLK